MLPTADERSNTCEEISNRLLRSVLLGRLSNRTFRIFAVDPRGRLNNTRMAQRGAIFLAIVSYFLGTPVAATGVIVSAVKYSPGGLQAQQQSDAQPREDETTTALMERVGQPAEDDITTFKKAGMQDVTPHILTDEERMAVEAALASLPSLNKQVLQQNLNKLAFVDGIPGEGTGLTSPSARKGLSNITLRASVINESLTTFLTNKERRVYKPDGSGLTISVTGTGTNALRYVLLHESTHVVDVSCGVTTNPRSKFVQGIWTGHSTLAPSIAAITPKTYFRGADHLPIAKASDVYDALAQTPFVSLYATASRQEDLAELVTWHEIYTQDGGDLIIGLKDAGGKTIEEWHPLRFPRARERFADVEKLLGSPLSCGNPT